LPNVDVTAQRCIEQVHGAVFAVADLTLGFAGGEAEFLAIGASGEGFAIEFEVNGVGLGVEFKNLLGDVTDFEIAGFAFEADTRFVLRDHKSGAGENGY